MHFIIALFYCMKQINKYMIYLHFKRRKTPKPRAPIPLDPVFTPPVWCVTDYRRWITVGKEKNLADMIFRTRLYVVNGV